MSLKYTADFETTTDENDCRVWAWGLCEIDDPSHFIYGNSMESFIDEISKDKNYHLFFHNLKFDGAYIISWLLLNEYEHIKDKKERRDKTFTTLISNMGQFYSIEIYFSVEKKKTHKCTIWDSLKILNFSVDKIAKSFNLPISKLEIDYHEKREVGHILTDEEVSYLRNDVEIMARALNQFFAQGLKKMTISGDAFHNFKELMPNFEHYFPKLPYEIDSDIRKSYKGGFTYLNPKYKGKEAGRGCVYDKNSMYPSMMYYKPMPIGNPIFFDGEYKEDKLYNLYVIQISASFTLKANKIPSIQIKHNMSFIPNEYVETTDGEIVTLTLTSVDFELFKSQYDIDFIEYHGGWKFKSQTGLFRKYIDYWSGKKAQAKKDGDPVIYLTSKLMLNSLYGRMGINPNVSSKIPYLDENEIVKYKVTEPEIRDSIYVPVASFITAYAREDIITTSQKIRDYSLEKYGEDRYIYSDTDSCHIELSEDEDLSQIIDVDNYRLGAWSVDKVFIRGKYIRQKCYIELGEDEDLSVTIAGLPKKLHKYITFDNFKEGLELKGNDPNIDTPKLTYKTVRGGVLLIPVDFSIK